MVGWGYVRIMHSHKHGIQCLIIVVQLSVHLSVLIGVLMLGQLISMEFTP